MSETEKHSDTFRATTEEDVILEMCARSLERCGALPLNARLEYDDDAVSEWTGKQIEQLWLGRFGG